MGNMDEIIKLCASTYNRPIKSCPVYRAIGTYFYIILDNNGADLRDLMMDAVNTHKPETIRTDYAAAMDDYVIANTDVLTYRYVGINQRIGTNYDIAANETIGINNGIISNTASFFNYSTGAYANILAKDCAF